MKSIFRIIIFCMAFLIVRVAVCEQVTPKQPYDSNVAQVSILKQQNLQLRADALTAQVQSQIKTMQEQWKAEDEKVKAWIEAVRKANGWDETYVYDREKDVWTHTPKPVDPKDSVKK